MNCETAAQKAHATEENVGVVLYFLPFFFFFLFWFLPLGVASTGVGGALSPSSTWSSSASPIGVAGSSSVPSVTDRS
jgi:hypothetical protein